MGNDSQIKLEGAIHKKQGVSPHPLHTYCMVQSYHIHSESHKHLNFHDKFDLDRSRSLVSNIHISSLKLKFPWLKSCCIHNELHKIFQFQGQFDLEGQGHKFLNPSEIFR